MDELKDFLKRVLKEDIGDGDHTSLATIPEDAIGKAQLLVKENGVAAGVDVAVEIFKLYDKNLKVEVLIKDGTPIKKGDKILIVEGSSRSILTIERTVLNIMQRMSGIATKTRTLADTIKPTKAKLLDTRKTTPNMRFLEKQAVLIGGGFNHRFGLYDMMMIKDNHIDFAGGIPQAIDKAKAYLKKNKLNLKIEIEVRDLNELDQVLLHGGVDRIMLDNFTPANIEKAVNKIKGQYETEASGGINESNILEYALTGVDYISVGALTHSVKSLDLSLKAF
ncbi:MAG TPA: carboxylating nicotinate-nucleotide diphosphorylase [Bacteroidia bacterium]